MSVSSSSSPQNNPQNCGYRLIPKLVDEIAQTDPQRPFISVPRSARVEDGFVDITYRQFAAAINRCCWWLDRQLGCSKTFDTLFYFGPLDYRHFIVVLAAAKTGHVVCSPSIDRVFTLCSRLKTGILEFSSQQP